MLRTRIEAHISESGRQLSRGPIDSNRLLTQYSLSLQLGHSVGASLGLDKYMEDSGLLGAAARHHGRRFGAQGANSRARLIGLVP
jgi:hypothetical protein